ncbi:hypothetical protein BSKO_11744 [Bryopsis sp. KO-2023]|nr:hypothetical protein BSKO_11744 [Bryopsis sp. KO-2023]
MTSFSKPSSLSSRPTSATSRERVLGLNGLIVPKRSYTRGFCKRTTSCVAAGVEGKRASSPAAPDVSSGSWMAMDEPPVWEGDEHAFMKSTACLALPPAVKMLLLSDGSMTRHIGLIRGEEVLVEPFGKPQRAELENIPELCWHKLEGPIVEREVFLRTKTTEPLMYATSWWNEETLSSYMKTMDKPMGTQLSARKVETHKEIDHVFLGESAQLSAALGEKGPFWGRLYTMWSGAKPICILYEVLSGRLLEQAAGSHLQCTFNGDAGNIVNRNGH